MWKGHFSNIYYISVIFLQCINGALKLPGFSGACSGHNLRNQPSNFRLLRTELIINSGFYLIWV